MIERRIPGSFRASLIALAVAVMGGCASEPSPSPEPPPGDTWKISISSDSAGPTLSPIEPPSTVPMADAADPPAAGPAPVLQPLARSSVAGGGSDDGVYRIGPEDLIEFSVVGEAELTRLPLRVSDHGFVDVPYAGALQAAGLTVDEFRRVLEVKLDEIFVKPQVVLALREYRSRMVHLLGEVHRPGPYKLTHGNTLMEVVSRAGGFTPLANRSDVEIIRQQGGQRLVVTVDVEDMLDEGRMDLDPELRAGDVIRVPERLF